MTATAPQAISTEPRLNDHDAGVCALLLRVISTASEATPQNRAMARRFTERFEAYRDDGIDQAAAYTMAIAEARAYLREMDCEGAFA